MRLRSAYIVRMRSNRLSTAAVLVVAAFLAACPAEKKQAAAPDNSRARDASVIAEIARVDADLKRLEETSLPDGFAPLAKQLREGLDRAKKSDTPELRLYRLRDPFTGVEALRFMTSSGKAMNDLAAFEALWKQHEKSFSAAEPIEGTTLQRALYQAAANRAQVLSRASLPYGRSSSPGDGVYYLGEAEGNRLFARFVASLPPAAAEAAPDKSAVAAAIESVQRETLAAYERDSSGKTTIPASAKLKEASELHARGWNDGAAFSMLEARLDLSRRDPASAGRVAVTAPKQHDSIAAWLEGLSRDTRYTKIVAADLMPLFNTLHTHAAAAATVAAPVTVTLVRWPYT